MRSTSILLLAILASWPAPPAGAQPASEFHRKIDRGALVVKRWPSIAEPPVPVTYNGLPLKTPEDPLDRFNVLEIAQQTSGTSHFPVIWSDLLSSFYLRSSYQKPDGQGADMGTSVLGTPCFRTPTDRQFLPLVAGASVRTGGRERVTSEIWGQFREPAEVSSMRTYAEPAVVGRTQTGLSIWFRSLGDIKLDPDQRGHDAFRLLTVSTMFTDGHRYDANVLRYQDAQGAVHEIRLADDTPRGTYLAGLPKGTVLGDWFELVKEPGSVDWHPDSPTVRVEIVDRSGIPAPGRLGLQAYLMDTVRGVRDPNDDSLSVWVEWLDAPEVVADRTSLRLDVRIIATPPSRVVASSRSPGH